MKIIKIDYIDKSGNFLIETDEKTEYEVSYSLYSSLNISQDMDIDEIIDKIKYEDSYIKAKKISQKFISYKIRSSFEVRNKLASYKFDSTIIDKLIDEYEKLNIINDYEYAKEYFKSLVNTKKLSKKLAQFKLREKGINSEIIEEVSLKYLSNDFDNAQDLLKKKFKNKDFSDYKERQKAYRFLASKGFSYSIIKKLLGEYGNE